MDGARKAQRVHQSILLRGGIDGVSGCYHDATNRTRRLSTRMVAATRVRERERMCGVLDVVKRRKRSARPEAEQSGGVR